MAAGCIEHPVSNVEYPRLQILRFGQMGNYQMLDAAAQMLTRLMIRFVEEIVSTGIADHYPGAIYALGEMEYVRRPSKHSAGRRTRLQP